jgi:RHH-type rel operon transcriptional repressor/antitoxin RelB
MPTMSLRLPDDLAAALADLATATGRRKSCLAIDALREYVERETWQVARIKKGIEQADAEEFATEEEVAALRNMDWTRHAG